jgi:UDP-N-acetylmuramate--alanine ligase
MMLAKKIYMVGIGGIGMSALAQYYAHAGAEVFGSDRDASPTTRMLEEKGIRVRIGQSAAQVPPDAELLVYSDAVPDDNPERVEAVRRGLVQKSYFEALGDVANTKRTIAVSGTNGKTTTTAMLGRMLIDAGLDPTVIVGSIVSEWGSNFRAGASDLLVVEACEYRNHFLVFNPEVLVITNIELDHTDFFKSLDEVRAAFDEARSHAKVTIDAAQYAYLTVPELLVPGEFNRENARAAKATAKHLAPEVADEVWDRSLASYKGTWRRFEYKGFLPKGAALYDDYAHHPTAIAKTIEAAREKFVAKKIIVAFHPHLYSRTRDLFDYFAQALAKADEVILLPVFAAREKPDPNFSHQSLADAINTAGGHARAVAGMDEATAAIKTFGADAVVFTMGAGDVYKAGEAALTP